MMQRIDRITGLILFCLSLGICIESIRLSLGTFYEPSTGFFPFISGTIIGLFSFILYLKNRKKERGNENFWVVGADKKAIFLTLIALFIYAFLYEVLGFLASSILFFIVMSWAITRQSWITAIFLAIFSSVGAYLIFQTWLKVQLPRGILM